MLFLTQLYYQLHLMMNFVFPETFNDELHVVSKLNVVAPDTFKVDLHVVMLFNRVGPEAVLKFTNEGGFNIEK